MVISYLRNPHFVSIYSSEALILPGKYEPISAADAIRKHDQFFLNNSSIAGIILTDMAGDIIYCSSNWNPDLHDVKEVIKGWRGGIATAVKIHGVSFSILQSRPDRFVSTNIKKAGHLIGAVTPGGQYLLAFILPSEAYDGVLHDLAAAAGNIRPGGTSPFSEWAGMIASTDPDLNVYFRELADESTPRKSSYNQ
jgi:hypothetical protein